MVTGVGDKNFCVDETEHVQYVEHRKGGHMTDRERIREWLLSNPIPIRQIALRAQVSRGTVYRIMRNGQGSRDRGSQSKTIDRLLEVMNEQKKAAHPG